MILGFRVSTRLLAREDKIDVLWGIVYTSVFFIDIRNRASEA